MTRAVETTAFQVPNKQNVWNRNTESGRHQEGPKQVTSLFLTSPSLSARLALSLESETAEWLFLPYTQKPANVRWSRFPNQPRFLNKIFPLKLESVDSIGICPLRQRHKQTFLQKKSTYIF